MAYLDRTRKNFVRGAVLAAAATAALMMVLAQTHAFEWLENGTYDARVHKAAKPDGDQRIVIIDIDDASFEQMKDQGWRWPWTRRAWTAIVLYLAPARPSAIVFDIVFAGKETDDVDKRLVEAMHDSGNVIIGSGFSKTEIVSTNPQALEQQWAILRKDAAPSSVKGELKSPKTDALNAPLQAFVDSAAGTGSITATTDPDGSIRRVPLEFNYSSSSYPSLALRTVQLVTGTSSSSSRLTSHGFQLNANTPVIHTDRDGRLVLWWHKNFDRAPDLKEGVFPYQRIPIWQMFCSMWPQKCAASVKKFPPEYFKDKIIIVGASAASSYDAHPTPFEDVTPGFLGHATAIDNLLHAQSVRLTPVWVIPLLIVVMAAAGCVIPITVQSTTVDFLSVFVLVGLYSGVAFLALALWHLWLPMVAPIGATLLSYVSCAAIRFATTGRELRRTRSTLDRYISPQLVGYVLNHIEEINLAGEKRELTIFFSDVRNFTTLTEQSDPVELIALLNEYLAAMTEIIFKYDGIVDKFIGDGILAYWGAFTPGKNHALLAAKASLEMIRRLEELNKQWLAAGRKPIAIGIGLNTGDVIFGNVGSGKKIEFTVIGDPVNLASRLEGLNKEFGTSIIISEQTRARLGDAAIVRALGGVKVKGKTIETAIYELRWLDATAPQPLAQPASAD
jgi:adenylate cyclase